VSKVLFKKLQELTAAGLQPIFTAFPFSSIYRKRFIETNAATKISFFVVK
jgi:hypothetical protein